MVSIENSNNVGTATPYIDRRVAEGLFREKFGEKSIYRVLNIYGKSGSGKTTFVNHIEDNYLVNSKDIIYIKIDFKDRILHKPQKFVMSIAKMLEDKFDFNFMALWKAYAILWHKRYENSPLIYASDLPYFHEIKKLLEPKRNKNILDIAKGIFGDKLSKELEDIKRLDTKKIEDKLYKFFANDLRRILRDNNFKDCVFILENIDTLRDNNKNRPCSKDAWIRDLITQIGKDALFLITSKVELDWKSCNQNWGSVIESYPMKPFLRKESLRYLRLSGVEDKNLQEAIAKSAKDEPFWLSFALLKYKSFEQLPVNKKDILDNFLLKCSSEIIKLLNLFAYSRFFTVDLIYVASSRYDVDINRNLIENLISMPFIKMLDKERYVIDRVLQEELKKLHTKEEEVDYLAFMFSYYENILQSIDSQVVEATPMLVDEAIEEAWYYLNLINSEPLVHFEWLDYYIDRFFMFATWEPFLERYNKIEPKLKESKDKTSKEKLISLYNNLAGLYESLGDVDVSKKYYNMVIKLNRPELLTA